MRGMRVLEKKILGGDVLTQERLNKRRIDEIR
jgi:hypothetical protein